MSGCPARRIRDENVAVTSLDGLLADATRVLVVGGVDYDPSSRQRTRELFRDSDAESVAQLVASLTPGPGPDDVALMQWPTLTFVMFGGDNELARVSYVNGWLRWDGWSGDRSLLRPNDLASWLAGHGITA
jgi:hypothetical protein